MRKISLILLFLLLISIVVSIWIFKKEPALYRLPSFSYNDMDVSEFNRSALQAWSDQEEWVKSPSLFVYQFLGGPPRHMIVEFRGEGERPNNYVVTVIKDGDTDDSVSGYKSILEIARGQNGWYLISAKYAWRCQEGRGHRYFSTELCR
ncbi:MAG TPA: hypothetical protein DF383_05135 [Deltaproteobacteria bacterium]|nr:hypothetical protein [Deltaproteobacteria bacterium]